MEERGMKKGTLISRLIFYFFCYSVIGWCYEVFLEVVVYRWGFSNRGVLFGPYCPVYGFGALIFMICLRGLIQKKICIGRRHPVNITPVLVFFGVVIIATGIELIASYLMEWLTGGFLWDYERFAFDFQGRIAPNPSLRFGIGGMVFIYAIQPFLVKACEAMGDRTVRRVAMGIALLMAADAVVTVMSMG